MNGYIQVRSVSTKVAQTTEWTLPQTTEWTLLVHHPQYETWHQSVTTLQAVGAQNNVAVRSKMAILEGS